MNFLTYIQTNGGGVKGRLSNAKKLHYWYCMASLIVVITPNKQTHELFHLIGGKLITSGTWFCP